MFKFLNILFSVLFGKYEEDNVFDALEHTEKQIEYVDEKNLKL